MCIVGYEHVTTMYIMLVKVRVDVDITHEHVTCFHFGGWIPGSGAVGPTCRRAEYYAVFFCVYFGLAVIIEANAVHKLATQVFRTCTYEYTYHFEFRPNV